MKPQRPIWAQIRIQSGSVNHRTAFYEELDWSADLGAGEMMGDHHIAHQHDLSTTTAAHVHTNMLTLKMWPCSHIQTAALFSVVIRASPLTSRHKVIADVGMTERGKVGYWCRERKDDLRDRERRGFDDKELWESEWVRGRGADGCTYEPLKRRKSEKER